MYWQEPEGKRMLVEDPEQRICGLGAVKRSKKM
jgi:hypothetical protein